MRDAPNNTASTQDSNFQITETPPNRPPGLRCVISSASTTAQALPSQTAAATAAPAAAAAAGSSSTTAPGSSTSSSTQPAAAAAGEQQETPTAADAAAARDVPAVSKVHAGRGTLDSTWGSSLICSKSSFGGTPLGRQSMGTMLMRAETWIVQVTMQALLCVLLDYKSED
jgi:hypothetical protein